MHLGTQSLRGEAVREFTAEQTGEDTKPNPLILRPRVVRHVAGIADGLFLLVFHFIKDGDTPNPLNYSYGFLRESFIPLSLTRSLKTTFVNKK